MKHANQLGVYGALPLSDEVALIAPLATSGWSLWLAYVLRNEKKVIISPKSDQSQLTDCQGSDPHSPGKLLRNCADSA